jgi:glycosyltransferase involved in cell wall biosynthesis
MISVIMAVYKEDVSLLKQSIESILNQTYRDFEYVIVLDDPDNDEAIELIRGYEQQDSRLHFFINENNSGPAITRNNAFNKTSGDYIAVMDADDIAEKNRLEMELSYLNKHKLDLIGSYSNIIDENGHFQYVVNNVPTKEKSILKALKYNQVVSHPTFFLRREVFTQLKGYRAIPLCEDYDFTLRAALHSFHIGNMPEIGLQYRMTTSSVSRTSLYKQYLYMVYLTRQYSKHLEADVDQAKAFVESKYSENRAMSYAKANVNFNKALYALKNKKLISFIFHSIKLFSSPSYLNKIYRLIRASLC